MGRRRLKPDERALRVQWTEWLLMAIRQHQDGITTVDLVEATGVTKAMAMKLLAQMSQDGLIGRRFALRRQDGNRVAHWLPDPGRGCEPNPYVARRSRQGMAPNFNPYPNADAEQEQWRKQVLERAARPKINPWGQV